jgi:hypothetical protein
LDWSRNPFVGLWFAVSDKEYGSIPGAVYQLAYFGSKSGISLTPELHLERADSCNCKSPVHLFPSPARIDRTERQRSVFTIATFKDDYALRALDEITLQGERPPIRRFEIPAKLKPEIRRLLADLGLDAYGVYGSPDSFGKSLTALLDLSDFSLVQEEKPPKASSNCEESPDASS